MSVKSLERRESILKAALAILLEQDGRSLTLDAVALRAGVSKGGLMHHFRSKEALLEAAYARMIDHVNDKVNRLSGGKEPGTSQELEAYISASLDQPFRAMGAELGVGIVSLLGEDMTKNTRLLDPLRRLYADRLKPFRSDGPGRSFARAAVIFLAVEAFLFLDIFSLCEFTDEELAAIKSELSRLGNDLWQEPA